MENLYLIVGLGNPGAEHVRTRHNAGFMVVDRLVERWRGVWRFEKKFEAKVARVEQGERRVLVCQPQTYMNASGEAVGALLSFYRVDVASLLVVVDDADLPLGAIRLRPGGSAGGHHGLESIESRLGTREYARLRIGIGRSPGARQITGYVLGRFQSTEAALLDKVLNTACEQAECWLGTGIQKAMSQYNGVIENPANEGKDE